MKLKFVAMVLPLLTSLFLFASTLPVASAQTQLISIQPGYVNLGMNNTISVTAPSAGTYQVMVVEPSGAKVTENYVFTSGGQKQNMTFGAAGTGFKALINETGTYNVFLESGGQTLSTSTFYATNKLTISFDVVQAGTCVFVQTTTRGIKFIPIFYVAYASNGALVTNANKNASVSFTDPSGAVQPAPYGGAGKWAAAVVPNWNFTNVGNWSPSANATDGMGNYGNFTYTGSPYVFMPGTLSTTVQLINPSTNQTIVGLSNGETVGIDATVTYPVWTAEPIAGYAGPLNATRGGVVTALVGYGTYNATTQKFGGTGGGALIGTVKMTYSGNNGLWTGTLTLNSSALPSALPAGTSYQVIVNSYDSASPPNTGQGLLSLPAASSVIGAATVTTTTSIVSTTTASAIAGQSLGPVPLWAYAAMVVLLVVGAALGYMAKRFSS